MATGWSIIAAVKAVMITVVVAGLLSPALVTLKVQVKTCAAQDETTRVLVKVLKLLDSVSGAITVPPLSDVQTAPLTVSDTVIEAVRVTESPVFMTTEWSAVLL